MDIWHVKIIYLDDNKDWVTGIKVVIDGYTYGGWSIINGKVKWLN